VEEIREVELARQYGVSKSPIRDALQKLEFEGLVTIEARRGHRVAPISLSDAADILEMREMLESGVVRKLARDGHDEALAQLDAYRTADTTCIAAFADYNRRFHTLLCDLADNARLRDTMGRLMEAYDRLCVVSLSTRRTEREAMEGALVEHCAIIDAIQSRNPAAAARRSMRHVRQSRGQIMRGLKARVIVA
jgi:DNA-binding GntR family transcriptional regulator